MEQPGTPPAIARISPTHLLSFMSPPSGLRKAAYSLDGELGAAREAGEKAGRLPKELPPPAKDMTTKRKKEGPSQLMELFLHLAELLGYTSDKDVAELAGVSPENVANWRSGAVQEFKPQKLKGIKANIAAQIEAMSEQAGAVKQGTQLSPIEIEEGSSPSELQRQFRDRVAYDYLGHRFLYYEPMGALAWEKLIGRGYEQASWLTGVESCADGWLDLTRDENG